MVWGSTGIFANQICESVYTGGGVRERERESERE